MTAVVVALLLALASASDAGSVQIRSDVDCPSAPDVAARLRGVLASGSAATARVSITGGAAGLTLTLADGVGDVVDARKWPASTDCAATAEAFAVVIAAWLGDLPQVRNTVTAPERSSSATVVARTAAPPRPRTWLTTALSAGVASPISGVAPSNANWVTAAIAGDILVHPRASRGFVGLALFANLPRELGERWYRLTAGPEAGYIKMLGLVPVTASAGMSAGALVATSSFVPPTSVYFDLAAFADLRVGLTGSAHPSWDLWLAAHGRASLRDAAQNDDRVPDARFEAALLLGGDYSWAW